MKYITHKEANSPIYKPGDKVHYRTEKGNPFIITRLKVCKDNNCMARRDGICGGQYIVDPSGLCWCPAEGEFELVNN